MNTSVLSRWWPASHWQAALSWCALSLGAKRKIFSKSSCRPISSPSQTSDQRGVILDLEPLDAERVTALLGGFGQMTRGAEDQLLDRLQRVSAEPHHAPNSNSPERG